MSFYDWILKQGDDHSREIPFMLFICENHYLAGGMGDFAGYYNSIKDALVVIEEARKKFPSDMEYATYHIFDKNIGKVLYNVDIE